MKQDKSKYESFIRRIFTLAVSTLISVLIIPYSLFSVFVISIV